MVLNARVIGETLANCYLTLVARKHIRAPKLLDMGKFQRHLPLIMLIPGKVDRAISALSQEFDKRIVIDGLPRLIFHRHWLILRYALLRHRLVPLRRPLLAAFSSIKWSIKQETSGETIRSQQSSLEMLKKMD